MIPFTVMTVSSLKYAIPTAALGVAGAAIALDANQIAIAIIAAVSGIISSYVGYKQWRGQNDIEKARVDITQTQARTAIQDVAIDRNDRLVDQLQEQLNTEMARSDQYIKELADLRKEVRELNNALVRYEVGTYKLIGQVRELNEEPVWLPAMK